MSTPNPVPHPGYKNAKPYIRPVLELFSELGAQDACLQLQEVAIVHLEKNAQSVNSHTNDYLRLLYIDNSIPQGSYSFADMRTQIYKSFIILTHAIFDKALKACNKAYQQKNPSLTWITTLKGGTALHPLEQLVHNCTSAEKLLLTQVPEFGLLEYYRRVRIAAVHINQNTAQEAQLAYDALSPADHQHFQQYQHLSGGPNAPSLLTFQDFRLYTRAIEIAP